MKTTAASMMWVMKLLEDRPARRVPAEQPAHHLHVKRRRLAGVVLAGAILLVAIVVSTLLMGAS